MLLSFSQIRLHATTKKNILDTKMFDKEIKWECENVDLRRDMHKPTLYTYNTILS